MKVKLKNGRAVNTRGSQTLNKTKLILFCICISSIGSRRKQSADFSSLCDHVVVVRLSLLLALAPTVSSATSYHNGLDASAIVSEKHIFFSSASGWQMALNTIITIKTLLWSPSEPWTCSNHHSPDFVCAENECDSSFDSRTCSGVDLTLLREHIGGSFLDILSGFSLALRVPIDTSPLRMTGTICSRNI